MPNVRLTLLSNLSIELVVAGSSALVASSQSNILGFVTNARAITRCFDLQTIHLEIDFSYPPTLQTSTFQ